MIENHKTGTGKGGESPLSSSGFTIVEMVLAITIFGLIVSYLYGALGELRLSNSLLLERDRELNRQEQFVNLLYRDIFEAEGFQIEKTPSENMVMHLQTKNSLYNSHFVYVKWFLNAENHKLIRGESTEAFTLPVSVEKLYRVKFDVISKDLETFRVYKSKSGDGVLISTKDINNSKVFAIELMKPKDVTKVAGSESNASTETNSSETNTTL
jgi:prepilin-type N-terminal cleavage/methylation domain-containing protein